MTWTLLSEKLPPEGEVVMTVIADGGDIRNEQQLVRKGNLFFFEDMSMYVYYRPTHWRYLTGQEEAQRRATKKRELVKQQQQIEEELSSMEGTNT
jgi:hypothetical protein